eukprot:COSAG01_NODE_27890_length_674_cov_1.086957_2_plen_55_part_01
MAYSIMTSPVDLEYTGCPKLLSCVCGLHVLPPLSNGYQAAGSRQQAAAHSEYQPG